MLGKSLVLSTLVMSGLLVAGHPRANPPSDETPQTEPREIGLIERARQTLAQLDVTVRGPRQLITGLGAGDFELRIAGNMVEQFVVDSLCSPGPPAGDAETSVTGGAAGTSYLFYFDQHHLTLSGRQNAIDAARAMIPLLVRGGHRVTIVSAGQSLGTFATWSGDEAALFEALGRLEADRTQWDDYPYLESSRHGDLQRAASTAARCALAATLQREETWRTEKALHLFSMVLNRFAALDPPKVAIYFADTVRVRSGEHYFFGAGYRCDQGMFDAQPAFDRVVDQANALGVRIYAVQAQGLVGLDLYSRAPRVAQNQAVKDAQSGLKVLGLETGGDAFLNGLAPKRMADRILDDQACMYLLSYDPDLYPADQVLSVSIRVKRRGVQVQARGRTIIPSESSRRTSRLLAAFGSPDSVRRDVRLEATVIPLGFEEGRFSGLLQIAVPGLPLDQVTWDIGGSLVSRGEVRSETSSRVSLTRRGVPVILESRMQFRPGPFELVLVAHEATTDQIATLRLEGAWPDRNEGIAVSDIAILQSSPGAFVRDGEVRTEGARGLPSTASVLADAPCILVSLVCRGRKDNEPLQIRRELVGEKNAPLPDMVLAFDDSPCAQVRDVIPGGTMTPGRFSYTLAVVRNGQVAITRRRGFNAIGVTLGSGQIRRNEVASELACSSTQSDMGVGACK